MNSFPNLPSTTQVMAVFRRSMASRRPLRRSFKKAFKKRNVTRGGRYGQVVSVPRVPLTGGFPETLVTTLRYHDKISITSSGTNAVGNIFRLNSIFDPDFTNVGHQPLYFDQFTPVYSRYSVLGSKITVKFTPASNITDLLPTGPWQVGITGNNDGSFASSPTTLIEQNKSVYTILGRSNAGHNVKQLSLTYAPLRDIGLPWNDDTVGAAVTTNPNSTWWSQVWIADMNGTSSVVFIEVTIEFRVKFLRQTSIAVS